MADRPDLRAVVDAGHAAARSIAERTQAPLLVGPAGDASESTADDLAALALGRLADPATQAPIATPPLDSTRIRRGPTRRRGASPSDRVIRRMTYAQAAASIEPPHTKQLLDRWLVYQANAGPESMNVDAAAILGPLEPASLAGALDYWLDEGEAHPSGTTKAEALSAGVGEWDGVIAKAKELTDVKVKKKFADQGNKQSPKSLLKAKIAQVPNAEISPAAVTEWIDELSLSARPHYLVPEKDLTMYLAGRAGRTFPPTLRATARTMLDAFVDDSLKEEIGTVVREYFGGQLAQIQPCLDDDGRLRRGRDAVIPEAKLHSYALDPDHKVGGNKARVFNAVLGFTKGDWKILDAALRQAVVDERAILETGRVKPSAVSVTIRFLLPGIGARAQNIGLVESGWVVPKDTLVPQLVTCYLIGGGKGWQPNIRYSSIFADGTLVTAEDHPERLPAPTWAYCQSKKGPRVEIRTTVQTKQLYQERHFDANGHPVKDVDHTSPVLPDGSPFPSHPPPGHEHRWTPKNPDNLEEGWLREGGDQ